MVAFSVLETKRLPSGSMAMPPGFFEEDGIFIRIDDIQCGNDAGGSDFPEGAVWDRCVETFPEGSAASTFTEKI